MKRILILVVTFFLVLSFTACSSSPTLDTSSQEAMKKSVEKIMAELSQKDQKRFTKALTGIYMYSAFTNMGKIKSGEDLKASVDAKIDGKTAKEIFAIAEDLKKKMKR